MQIEDILRIVILFRELDPDIQFSVAQVFLMVAQAGDEGVSLTDIANKANLGLSSVSRHVAALGKINRKHEEGFGLIRTHEDPMERRRRLCTLTPRGKAFLHQLVKESA
jgi:DNA-binding MarR family transcriptional regulator